MTQEETLVHSPECKKYAATAKMRRTKFLKRYPHYCRACDAYGIVWEEDHEGILEDYPCYSCLAKDLCPRCGTETMVEKQRSTVYRRGKKDQYTLRHGWEQCLTCGWRGDDDYGDKYCLPMAHTYYCKEERS